MEFTQEKAMKLKDLLANAEFVDKAKILTTAKELQSLFSEYDLEMTLDEVVEFCALIAKEKKRIENDGELSLDDLDDVSGGGVLFVLGCIGLGVTALAGLAIGIYNGYKGNS